MQSVILVSAADMDMFKFPGDWLQCFDQIVEHREFGFNGLRLAFLVVEARFVKHMRDVGEVAEFCDRIRSVREIDGNVWHVVAAGGFTPREANHFPIFLAVQIFRQRPSNNTGGADH